MNSIIAKIMFFLDVIVPRFIEEEVAFCIEYDTCLPELDAYVPLCALSDVTEDDEVEMVGTLRSFNLFGVALFPKLIGELRPYEPIQSLEG